MLYAAYGSNLHPDRLALRVPSARLVGTARLPAWRLVFNKRSWVDGSGKCTLAEAPASERARLALFEIEPAERALLDRAEGLGRGYRHHEVGVDRVRAEPALRDPDTDRRALRWSLVEALTGSVARDRRPSQTSRDDDGRWS